MVTPATRGTLQASDAMMDPDGVAQEAAEKQAWGGKSINVFLKDAVSRGARPTVVVWELECR